MSGWTTDCNVTAEEHWTVQTFVRRSSRNWFRHRCPSTHNESWWRRRGPYDTATTAKAGGDAAEVQTVTVSATNRTNKSNYLHQKFSYNVHYISVVWCFLLTFLLRLWY